MLPMQAWRVGVCLFHVGLIFSFAVQLIADNTNQLAICIRKRERSLRIWTAQRPLSIACLCMSRCVSSSDQFAICIGKRERSLRIWLRSDRFPMRACIRGL